MDDFNKKLSSLSEISKEQLAKLLKHIPGYKDLTLEKAIIRPLERICGVSWLKNNGIGKIFKLDPTVPKLQNTQVYMIYTSVETFQKVVDLIQSQLDLENPESNRHHVICVPKSLHCFEQTLEELGLIGTVVKLYSFQWFPINIDSGLLSLELPNMYASIFIRDDYTLLPAYAKAFWHLFCVFGKPKFILTLGQYSNVIMNQMNTYHKLDVCDKTDSDFGGLVLIDRSVDYPSALLTPGTYTALLKEVYSIYCGVCEYKGDGNDRFDDKFNPTVKKQAIQFPLDSSKDGIYKDIKHRYFTEVTTVLSQLTKQLRSEGESSKGMALDEIKAYVKTQLQAVTSKKKNLTNHLVAAETIINALGSRFEMQMEIERNVLQNKNKNANYNYLEVTTQTANDKYASLQLFCLMACTQKLTESECKSFLHKYFLEFGFDAGFLYQNLIKTNFINQLHTGSIANISSKIIKMPILQPNNFYVNANRLKQIPNDPEKIDLKSPNCSSYIYGGNYVPLISQIVSLLIAASPLDDIKNKLANFAPLEITKEAYPLSKKSLLVCIVGGITYSEVAALNLLEKLMGARIVIISDNYISGKDIADALITI